MSTTPIASAHVCTPPQTPSEYVAQLPAWDGEYRLGAWAARVFKKTADEQDSDLAHTGRWFITDMVARAMPPFFDARGKLRHGPGFPSPYLLVLAGPAGSRKSVALQTLAGQWCNNSNVLDDYNPDMALEGSWLHEIQVDGFSVRAFARLKDFVNQTHYQRRLPYTAGTEMAPRTVMFAATTTCDTSDQPTNRWTRKVTLTRDIADIEWLVGNREQLFAEAKAYLLYVARETQR